VEQEKVLLETKNKKNRAIVGRKETAIYVEAEKQISAWIHDARKKGAIVNGFSIQTKVRELLKEKDPFFKASTGWLRKFLKRNDFSLRRITTTGRDLNSKCIFNIPSSVFQRF